MLKEGIFLIFTYMLVLIKCIGTYRYMVLCKLRDQKLNVVCVEVVYTYNLIVNCWFNCILQIFLSHCIFMSRPV